MTADARAGVVLGLVFILIIVYMVNTPDASSGSDRPLPALAVPTPEESPNVVISPPSAAGQIAGDSPTRPQNSRKEEPANPRTPSTPTDKQSVSDAPPARRTAQPARYTVKKGDCLTKIIEEVYGPEFAKKKATFEAIARCNGLKSLDELQIGQVLLLPDLGAATAPEPSSRAHAD